MDNKDHVIGIKDLWNYYEAIEEDWCSSEFAEVDIDIIATCHNAIDEWFSLNYENKFPIVVKAGVYLFASYLVGKKLIKEACGVLAFGDMAGRLERGVEMINPKEYDLDYLEKLAEIGLIPALTREKLEL